MIGGIQGALAPLYRVSRSIGAYGFVFIFSPLPHLVLYYRWPLWNYLDVFVMMKLNQLNEPGSQIGM